MALNTEDIEDIKQLITANNAVLLQAFDEQMDRKLEEKLEAKLDLKFDEKLAPIHKKIDDLIDFVSDAIDTSNDVTGKQLTDHEQRITKLEHRVA